MNAKGAGLVPAPARGLVTEFLHTCALIGVFCLLLTRELALYYYEC
jgi:hypothetical protein